MLLLALFWFVQFTDKLGSTPIQFSERAAGNRLLWSIPTDSLDYAINDAYIQGVRACGARVCHVSRWMNGLTMEADSATMLSVQALPYVASVELTRDNTTPPSAISPRKMQIMAENTQANSDNEWELKRYNLLPLHNLGYEGQDICIAVIDGGFYKVNTASCFANARNRLVGTYDYSTDQTDIYGSDGAHGAACLSFIAAQTGTYHGAATSAEYVLIRTEECATESPKEMDNLVAALELCDSLGVNIVSCSLGYRTFDNSAFDLTHADLDGKATRVSRAAAIAARKGMLLCCSAGNDGHKSWHKISVPADADSILTVGAVGKDSVMGIFSSYGPSADGRVKPEVCAVGVSATYVNPSTGKAASGNGTSFACPLIAGLAACLWSAMPDATAQEIRTRIIESAHRYPSYDPNNQMGYGIPDAWEAYQITPTALPQVNHNYYVPARKVLRNGHVYILHNEKVLNLLGQGLSL